MSEYARRRSSARARPTRVRAWIGLATVCVAILGYERLPAQAESPSASTRLFREQAPDWSADDLEFFLHGSMGTEVVPELVLQAFRATFPDLFPGGDLTAFGLIGRREDESPIGVSRRSVPHLGGLRSIGINCASCHVTAIVPTDGGAPARILGVTSHFDAEAFFGAVAAGTFQTSDPANMSRFLTYYFEACEPGASAEARTSLASALREQSESIAAAITQHQAEERASPSEKLYELDATTLMLDAASLDRNRELTPLVRSLMRLFHNMRAALHIPHTPPAQAPPRSGPGRNNAFGVLSVALFGEPTLYGPAKFGPAWNLQDRTWVHWDGNTRSPIVRNLAASLGLGAPLSGKKGIVDFALVERHTRLSEQIRAPCYPWKIDEALAGRGRVHFDAHCASCHVRPRAEEDLRLYAVEDVKTDPNRARMFNDHQASLYNKFFAELEVPGYKPSSEPPVRSTQKYVAVDLAGVWARSPYLHNGSVRTMLGLLTPAGQRAKTFQRGARGYDTSAMGYIDAGPYVLDTTTDGNANTGHEYGTAELTDVEKRELIEFLKTL